MVEHAWPKANRNVSVVVPMSCVATDPTVPLLTETTS